MQNIPRMVFAHISIFFVYEIKKYGLNINIYSLEQILESANDIIAQLQSTLKPYPYFKEYVQTGYYPFFMEGNQWFYDRLEGITKAVIESDFLILMVFPS